MTSVRKLIIRVAIGVLAVALLALAPLAPAGAQNLFQSFFGELGRALGAQQRAPAPAPTQAFAEPLGDFGRPPPPSPRIETGPSKAFCVRTCDGHYFPVRAHAGMSVAQACRAFCPASETRVYSGSTIDYAVAGGGSRYRDLPKAYAYRRQLVPGCTCNGGDVFGLARVDVASDPTLRPGDVVATNDGLMVFTGRTDNAANFTPIQSYSHFSKSLRQQLSELRVTPPNRRWPSATPAVSFTHVDNFHSAQR